jgi:DnaJ-class molecular chaperone
MPGGSDEAKPGAQRVPASGGTRNPGDESRANAPQTGDAICPACNGTGGKDEAPCETCCGSGRVVVIVGDA